MDKDNLKQVSEISGLWVEEKKLNLTFEYLTTEYNRDLESIALIFADKSLSFRRRKEDCIVYDSNLEIP